jgi:hypothetical protein
MDGVLALHARHHFTADDIVKLECRMPPGGIQVDEVFAVLDLLC